uniref:CXXC-type domain-containing protein n=1 Tax=Megaselia scalaris TaxID=36166 RepID=T1GVD9_MEGSC
MDVDPSNNPGQVDAVSSTANFKSPMNSLGMGGDSNDGTNGDNKKRKRCGECIGCQRKDNCGDCAPCRNDKSHQICKQRRCEKLTDKKLIYGADGQILRTESRRGRGKGRGGGFFFIFCELKVVDDIFISFFFGRENF